MGAGTQSVSDSLLEVCAEVVGGSGVMGCGFVSAARPNTPLQKAGRQQHRPASQPAISSSPHEPASESMEGEGWKGKGGVRPNQTRASSSPHRGGEVKEE